MAELNTDDGGGGGKKGKHQKQRAKKSSTKIDMTPMVDLAFLLLTFFMLTTTFNKPKTMEINMPADPENKEDLMKVNNALTFLLTEKNRVFYYFGEMKKGETQLQETNFGKDGVNKILLEYNRWTRDEIEKLEKRFKAREIADTTFKRLSVKAKGDKRALMALVKTDDKATYGNVIDMLDEINICYVGKYAVVDISGEELELLNQSKQ
jgi:biopolymer transport protein ExbD